MKSSTILLISINIFSVGYCFLNDPSLFDGNPELCSELNMTMFNKIGDILESLDLIDDNRLSAFPETLRRKRSNHVNINFVDSLRYPEKGTEFRINLPEGFNFTSLKDTDKLPNVIDPATYHVKIFEFLGDEAQFVLITGERCKYWYNSTSENYERQFCWKKPSFCRGNIIRCFQNDGPESLCYDEVTGQGNKAIENGNFENLALPNIAGKALFESWNYDFYTIFGNGIVNLIENGDYHFICYEYFEVNKTAYCQLNTWSGISLNTLALKTLSGYAG